MVEDKTVTLTPRWAQIVFNLVSIGFLGASVFHLAAIIIPGIAEPSPNWRHGLFVLINGLVAAGFFRRPQFFAWIVTALTLQQLYSHGTHGWQVYTREARLDWASVVVLVALPPLTGMLWWDVLRRLRQPK